MEKSLKRVERLVHATNSALAQMKLGLMFDDAAGEDRRRAGACGEPPGLRREGAEDLRQCQADFRSEAEEMLAKMEKMLESKDSKRKNFTALSRIKQINRKMCMMRQERGKLVETETERSRQKLLSLTAEEKAAPERPDCGTPLTAPKTVPPLRRDPQRHPGKTDPPSLIHPPAKTKHELKNKILETREIVDRGFHTARQLVQKVDNMAKNEKKEKTSGSEKTVSEMNAKSSDGKSEGNETTRSVRCRKVEKSAEKGRREEEGELGNAKVVNVRRRESRAGRRVHLKLQRLPSVHITGSLQLQKVHSLEIPAGGRQGCTKANTSIQILSHEEIERTKLEKILEGVRQENCCCAQVLGGDTKNVYEYYVECCSCGQLTKVHGSRGAVDPRELDEILRKCNFNVFDPRIDEFVEKHGATNGGQWCKPEVEVAVAEGSVHAEEKSEASRKARHFTLEDLSHRLSSKYREEADALEGTHLELDKLLRTLLRKMDESREAFEECPLFKNEKVLTATKPVVVSLPESSSRNRRKQKLDKKDVKNRSKSRTEEVRALSMSSVSGSVEVKKVERIPLFSESLGRKRKPLRREKKNSEEGRSETGIRKAVAEEILRSQSSTSSCRSVSPDRPTLALRKGSGESALSTDRKSKVEETAVETSPPLPAGQWTLREEERAPDDSSTPSSSTGNLNRPEGRTSGKPCGSEGEELEKSHSVVSLRSEGKAQSASTVRSDDNYESDFETSANELEEEPEPELIACTNKLSTISEEDSEFDKKVSDGQKTQKGSLNSETPLDEFQEDFTAKYQPSSLDLLKAKKISPLTSDVSRKSWRPEDTPPRSADASLKSTPTELVTSLKDILSALKVQFARTETLAEKLTENSRREMVRPSSARERAQSPWRMVEGLRSARREEAPTDTPSGEVGSSLGEVVVVGRRRKGGSSSETSFLKSDGSGSFRRGKEKVDSKLNPSSEEVSYSEGEIPSDVLQDSECCSSHSVGEIHV